jgi:hypothetical protein
MNLTIQSIDPRGTTPQDWCDRMVLELDRFGTIPIIGIHTTWKEWARQVIQIQEIALFDPPNPEQYADEEFEDWAIDFNDAVFAGD